VTIVADRYSCAIETIDEQGELCLEGAPASATQSSCVSNRETRGRLAFLNASAILRTEPSSAPISVNRIDEWAAAKSLAGEPRSSRSKTSEICSTGGLGSDAVALVKRAPIG